MKSKRGCQEHECIHFGIMRFDCVPTSTALRSARSNLLIILHQTAQLLRTAEHSQGIAGMQRPRVCRVHF